MSAPKAAPATPAEISFMKMILMVKLIQKSMNKKLKISIFIIFVSLAGFLVFNPANAAQVSIDNFDVVQKDILSTSSKVDFKLKISQQDQNLDCSNLPATNGKLEWAVWYEVPGESKKLVRKQKVSLPLSSSPVNLDFSVASFTPTSAATQNGGMKFRAAAACTVYFTDANMNKNLAVSVLVPVTISGGGGDGDGGGEPGEEVTFEIKNPIEAESLVDLAKAIGKFIFQIAIPIAVIVIIYAGILFLTSGGNKEKVTKARTALLYAVIGLTIILIGQGFFTLIKSILNLGGPVSP